MGKYTFMDWVQAGTYLSIGWVVGQHLGTYAWNAVVGVVELVLKTVRVK